MQKHKKDEKGTWVKRRVEIRGCAQRCRIIQKVPWSNIESNWILILNYIEFGRHVERMKLKNCIWPRYSDHAPKVWSSLLYETYVSIIYQKVHGIKPVALELKKLITLKMHRIGLPLQLQRKTHGKWWILKLMIIYEFGCRTLSRFGWYVIWTYLLMFQCRISIKKFPQNC